MGELAGDKYSIQKRATRCILPWKRRCDGLCAFDADLVAVQVQRFQRGVDFQHLGNNVGLCRPQLVIIRSCHIELLQSGVRLQRFAEDAHNFGPKLVGADAETFQRGTEKPNRKRDALVSRLVVIG